MNPSYTGLALVISAPSGAGKSTLVRRLLQGYPEFSFSVSCTTRAPREGERDGREYHFLSRQRFEELNESHPKTLDHGDYWCLECHATTEREYLVLENGTELQYSPENSSRMCQQCHANLYSDWQDHIHGRWVGNWSDPEPGQYCVDCHDPHDTHPAFHQIDAEPAPAPPAPKSQTQGLLPPNFGFIAGVAVAGSVALIGYAMTGRRRER